MVVLSICGSNASAAYGKLGSVNAITQFLLVNEYVVKFTGFKFTA
jgi:hypothetical protein